MTAIRFPSRRLAASLNLAFIAIAASRITAFEIPFPQTGAQIRSSIVSSDVLATSSPSLPVPITQTVKLSSGTSAEIITCRPKVLSPNFLESIFRTDGNKSNKKPVLAFLHGSFHASWCWAEHYMPFFAERGYECVSLSLQGTGGTPAIPQGSKKVQISSHVADFDAFLKGLSSKSSNNLGLELGDNPQVVLIGHSFGGLTIMKWLEKYYSSSDRADVNLAGVGLLCSVPPSGNGPMTLRYLLRSFKDSYKITVGFAMKKAIVDKTLCRELFFGGDEVESGISDEQLEKYQSHFERDTVATIDLKDLAGKLPSKLVDKKSGKAPFADDLRSLALKPFVLGATGDFIVDKEGLIETCKYMGLDVQEDVKMIDSPHDVMLGAKWMNGAEAILKWIEGV
ncbi:hypothetical protein ACHAXN_013129 [Cyclotella atomus]